ncbi:DNA-binding MarR family transcriptional regulator [Crossiella equi]|uniref:DNA-binding MarR family transcriptional regulator n=1 Tax=Crossiella equi TaxID=130796 RepID=A0ABS5AS44_9PSEU|nr:MarR family winged helix-turn-helix transcriptional regulator [Crossiella equi]MBP2479217.1 DNA-binding MarR family transcriptional regulator [Crossiella equi]
MDGELERAIESLEPHAGVQLLSYLTRAVRVLESSTRPVLKEGSGLDASEFDLLLKLWQLPGHRGQASEVGNAMGLTSSGITRLVSRAMEKDLVRREPDPSDGRGYLLTHTEKGKQALLAALQVHARQLDDELVGRMKTAELEVLMTLLSRIDRSR